MPWIGPAIQAGGSIVGGIMGAGAAGDAAGAQADALRGALQVQDRNTQAGIQANAPYAYTGKLANQRLRALPRHRCMHTCILAGRFVIESLIRRA